MFEHIGNFSTDTKTIKKESKVRNKTVSIHKWHDYLGKDPKEPTSKIILELISAFTRVVQSKVYRENSMAFLNTESKQWDTKINDHLQ